MMIYVGANLIRYMTIICFAQKKFLGNVKSFIIYTYGFGQYHMTRRTVCLDGFTVMMLYIITLH